MGEAFSFETTEAVRGYLCSGVWLLLGARLIWRLAFAAMNIANQALPTSHLRDALQRMGRTRSIVAVGAWPGCSLAASWLSYGDRERLCRRFSSPQAHRRSLPRQALAWRGLPIDQIEIQICPEIISTTFGYRKYAPSV
jgi:hypothetical protein